jgi:uncharacterized phage protein (TIGR01671 family)
MLGFRVWDAKDKCFYPHPSWNIDKEGNLMWGECKEEDDRYIPMQSTGLKDCNEVEIFEGDIIEFYTDCEDELQFLQVKNVTSFLVEAGEYQACMENDEIGFSEYTTVTGNVYECPSLLERLK